MLSDTILKIQPLPQIVFGAGSADSLAKAVARLDRKQALIVTDKGLVDAGLIAPLAEQLQAAGIETKRFDGVGANPTDRNVADGVAALAGLENPVVIAVGGGSSMDCAKAISVVGANEGGAVTEYGVGCKPAKPAHPIIAVPTTAGTGSETNMFSLITVSDLHRKVMVCHPSVMPHVAILDPKLTTGLPPFPTATCGFDVLTHAVEAYTARGANPYSDAVAIQAVRVVRDYLPRAFKDGSDLEARSQMLLASAMAAIAFNVAGLGVCHGTGHPISARYNTAHGQTLATMLPHVMRFNLEPCTEKYAEIAAALNVVDSARNAHANAQAAIDEIARLRHELGLEKSLAELGGSQADIQTLVDDALADITTRSNPRKVEAQDAAALYEAALA